MFLLQITGSGTRYRSIRTLWELTRGGFKEEAECKIWLDWKNSADEGSIISYGRGWLFREIAKHYLWWGGEERVQKPRIQSTIQIRKEPQGSLGRIQLISSFLCKIDMEKPWPFDHWHLWNHSMRVQRTVYILTRFVSLAGRTSEEVRRESRLFAFSRTLVNLSDKVWVDSWLVPHEVDPVLVSWNGILSRQSLYWLATEESDPVVEKRAVSVWILYII